MSQINLKRGTARDQSIEQLSREAATAAGFDPDERVPRDGTKPWPRWCEFRPAIVAELAAKRAAEASEALAAERIAGIAAPQDPKYRNSPLTVFGEHDEGTLTQMRTCMGVGNVVAGTLCADGHIGYAQPIGGVIAYEDQISISGVGYDICCGNMAVRLDTHISDIASSLPAILEDISNSISFGVGRKNEHEKVEHELFDDGDAWRESGMEFYRAKALSQLTSCGSGNHYCSVYMEEGGFTSGRIWIGVHFGSRGLGHTTATKYLKLAGGKDGMHVPPTVIDVDSDLGRAYLAGMRLAGRYAYAGREMVVDRIRRIIGGTVVDTVHNHHNDANLERHGERDLWVVRKGATPAFPGQRGFVGGSMGDNSVILEGIESEKSKTALYSAVHGAGRLFGRKQALRTFTRTQMDAWVKNFGVLVRGGDLDESPMAYRRLPEVLAHHEGTVRVLHNLRPVAVLMAGKDTVDPWKD